MKQFKSQELIQALNTILNIEQGITGLDYLKVIVKNIARTFEARFVFVGHTIRPECDTVQTDVVWAGDSYIENFDYLLKGTPCEKVYSAGRVCVHPSRVAEKFPGDKMLAEMGVESYIGAPLMTEESELSGILALLSDNPIPDSDFYSATIDFLSMRIGAELYRHHIEETLNRQVAERTRELQASNKKLREALSEIKALQGIIPICSKCKKVRDDQGFWQQVESYISNHSEAKFSHAICPECMKEYYHQLNNLKSHS